MKFYVSVKHYTLHFITDLCTQWCGPLVVALSLFARMRGGGRFGDSLPACVFFFFFSGDQLARTNSTFFS